MLAPLGTQDLVEVVGGLEEMTATDDGGEWYVDPDTGEVRLKSTRASMSTQGTYAWRWNGSYWYWG